MQIITNQFQNESNSFMWHYHPEIEITFVKKGSMHYRVNNRSFHLKEGDIIFCNSNALHTGEMENQEDCSYIPITFDPKLIYGFFRSTICTKYVTPVIQNLSACAMHIDYSESWHTVFRDRMLEVIDLDKKRPDFYELDISIRMQTNYMNHITLAEISEHIHLCESECTRLFKRHMNTTLFSFLQDYRIERSLEYLSSEGTISEIAGKVGFSDSNYYSKVFAKVKGCSPREYRKNLMK